MPIRQPIVLLCGHVDHGKSSILEKIREISITKHEAGGITQTLKSYNLPLKQVNKIAGHLIEKLNIKLTIPGILFLDSPGHAAFTNLRKRGGNLADLAILVIDIREGVMPQTIESIEILKSYKTPFIIALNKIDSLSGWHNKDKNLIKSISLQQEQVTNDIETRLYRVVQKLGELNLNADRFDRIENYTKQIAIIPCSAKTSEGLPELLMVLTGLAQKYLEQELKLETTGPAKGIVLEIKEERGLGKILDTVIYDGTIKKGDKLAIATLSDPITTKIKNIFVEERGRLTPKEEITAANGVIISAPDLDNALSGMPFVIIKNNSDEVKNELKKEIGEVLIDTEKDGIIVKADTLGSLEALMNLLKLKKVKIKKASIGSITKKDISDAKSEKELANKIILGFNIDDYETQEAKIITNQVIYKIIEDYESWLLSLKKQQETKELENIIYPVKIQVLRGCVFRQSNPCVVGIRVISGILKNDTPLMKDDGSRCSEVKSMQNEGENLQKAEKNQEAAIAIPHITVGRQIFEDTILYSDIPEEDFIKLKKLKKLLKHDEIEILKEIALIKRKNNPLWGI
ncbi:translation initiation factor IF-2 [Candidatus Woesearchaeota archaeon]|nr:translation initiation factor IF-2 [Candidatus Woesearchaeota archaeon]